MEGLGPVALLGYMVVISKAIESRDQWESQIGRDNTATNLQPQTSTVNVEKGYSGKGYLKI
jgi:hypothetical protein